MTKLQDGLLFEDTGEFLKWGRSINKILKEHKCQIENRGDRTVYHWGKHEIINGLELDLSNTYWISHKGRWFRKFNEIEYWAKGDAIAQSEYERILEHVTKKFGAPTNKEFNSNEKSVKWVIGKVQIHLFFFEQHCYKVHFTIRRKKFAL